MSAGRRHGLVQDGRVEVVRDDNLAVGSVDQGFRDAPVAGEVSGEEVEHFAVFDEGVDAVPQDLV